jgi:hypothetical protein
VHQPADPLFRPLIIFLLTDRRPGGGDHRELAHVIHTCHNATNLAIALNVIRMIKLFGWEPQMQKKIGEKRDVELKLVWKAKLIDVALDVVKCVHTTSYALSIIANFFSFKVSSFPTCIWS